MAYASLTEFKTYRGVSNTKDDTLITSLLDRATVWLDREAKRTLYAENDTTRNFDSIEDVEGMTLYLDDDLAVVTTITNGDEVVISSSEYVTEPRNNAPYHAIRLLASSQKSWDGKSNGDSEDAIEIVGKWSYFASVPNDLKHFCVRLAAYAYTQKDATVFDTVAIPDAGVINIPNGFPADVGRWIRQVRRLR